MSAGTMLARRQLRLAALSVLEGLMATAGVAVVESPPATATQPKQMPYIGLRCGIERKIAAIAASSSWPIFTTRAFARGAWQARVSAATKESAQDGIEALGFAIEQSAVLTRAPAP